MAQIQIDQKYRLDAFELWYWRRFLGNPWTARRSSQSIPKEINPEYSLGRLWLKLQHFDVKSQLFGEDCWERLKAKGEGRGRG